MDLEYDGVLVGQEEYEYEDCGDGEPGYAVSGSEVVREELAVKVPKEVYDAEEELFAVFESLDSDGDYFVSADELSQGWLGRGELVADEETDEAVRAADVDGDDLIGFEDFRLSWEAQVEAEEFEG